MQVQRGYFPLAMALLRSWKGYASPLGVWAENSARRVKAGIPSIME